jgi:DNA-binding CsgD family transcriptional regulator/DNA-binding Lrp family transcriptional regulator
VGVAAETEVNLVTAVNLVTGVNVVTEAVGFAAKGSFLVLGGTRRFGWPIVATWHMAAMEEGGGAMELTALGLSEEDALVYTALIGQGRATAAEMAKVCGLTPAGAGRVLARLVRSGFARRTGTRPACFFLPVEPDSVLSELIDARQTRLNEARLMVHRLMDIYRDAVRVNNPDLAVSVLGTGEEISAAVRQIQDAARVQVRAFDRPPYVDRPGAGLRPQIARSRLGVRHRAIYDHGALAVPGRIASEIRPGVRAGEQARIRPELPLKMVLSDDAVGVIPFSVEPRGRQIAYLVHRSSLLAALIALFEAEWDRAVPFADHGGAAADGDPAFGAGAEGRAARDVPDEDTRNLLDLLAAGLSDAAIARALGWSPRTTQRRLHQLMERLGAPTRFQAGILAARRGWL